MFERSQLRHLLPYCQLNPTDWHKKQLGTGFDQIE